MRINAEITSKLIREALDRCGENQDIIAGKLKIDQSRISCYRRGKFSRLGKGLQQLCEYLKVKPHISPPVFEPQKHPELISTLAEVIDGDPENEKAVLLILKNAGRLGMSKNRNSA